MNKKHILGLTIRALALRCALIGIVVAGTISAIGAPLMPTPPNDTDRVALVVFPFESVMLLSDINRLLANRYDMTLDEIRTLLRTETAAAIVRSAGAASKTIGVADKDDVRDLSMLYGSGNYKQLTMHGSTAPEAEAEAARLKEGEIQTVIEYGKPYMGFVVSDTSRWSAMRIKHGAERIMLLTQLDIRNTVRPESTDTATGYLIRLHFVWSNGAASELIGGAASVWMPLDSRVDLLDNLKARLRDVAGAVMRAADLAP